MKKVVLIGGGHGLSNLVRGFKKENIELSVIVSSTDDGGHTGKIREEFDSVAVGDLRMVFNEFLGENSVLKDIFNYRFNYLHGIKGVSLGNLMIVSLWEKYKDMNKVIDYFREKEEVTAKIYLSSNNPLTLCATCENGETIRCEREIGVSNKRIKKLFVDTKAVCSKQMLEDIILADIIVLSAGSLYTSVGSVLCIEDIKGALSDSKATIFYVCNIMEQYGETEGYSVEDHVNALEDIMGRRINKVIINDGKIAMDILERYEAENSRMVECLMAKDNYQFYNLIETIDGKVRHNGELVAKIILNQ